jgi:hypothetical protein
VETVKQNLDILQEEIKEGCIIERKNKPEDLVLCSNGSRLSSFAGFDISQGTTPSE